jgi:hypothetical protein
MSAANAGAAENASAATIDKTTFFITLPLFGSTGFQPIPFGRRLGVRIPAAIDPYAKARALLGGFHL